jgi:hypothetical protein
MARPRKQTDEEEASASFSGPMEDDGHTPFERETLERIETERRQFAASEAKRKAQDARIDRDQAAVRIALSKKIRAVLLEHYKDAPVPEDIVNPIMRDIDPIIAAGKDGRRRERGRMFTPPPKSVAA